VAVSTSGTFTPPDGKPLEGLPTFCRGVGVIRPTSDSHIEFEVWLPVSGWNGKFQGIGNGGFAGAISFQRPDYDLRSFDFEPDAAVVEAKLRPVLNATSRTSRPFRSGAAN